MCVDDDVVERRRVGSIADYDPINEHYGSLTQGYQPTSRGSVSSQSYEWHETFPLPQRPASSLIHHHQPTERADDAAAAAAGDDDACKCVHLLLLH